MQYSVKKNGNEVFRGCKFSVAKRLMVAEGTIRSGKMIKGYWIETVKPEDPNKIILDRIERRLQEYDRTTFPIDEVNRIDWFVNELRKRGHKIEVLWYRNKSFHDPVKKRVRGTHPILQEIR